MKMSNGIALTAFFFILIFGFTALALVAIGMLSFAILYSVLPKK